MKPASESGEKDRRKKHCARFGAKLNKVGSVAHEKLMVLLTQRIADGRVLAILESIMKVGYSEHGKVHQTQRGCSPSAL